MFEVDAETAQRVGEILGLLFAGAVASLLMYLKTPKSSSSKLDPVVAGIGMGIMEKHEVERALTAWETIAKNSGKMATALDALADKRQADLVEAVEEIKEALKHKT